MIKRISWLAMLHKVSTLLDNIANLATYLLPKQSLGPTWKGSRACRLSLANRGSPSQRSGTKENGSLKLLGEVYVARCGALTIYCNAIVRSSCDVSRVGEGLHLVECSVRKCWNLRAATLGSSR